jgi:hypothetical protein
MSALFTYNPPSFYPGLAQGEPRARLTAADLPIGGNIAGPEDSKDPSLPVAEYETGPNIDPRGTRIVKHLARPARVVGSLQHEVLPMPPVNYFYLNDSVMLTSAKEEDSLSCYGLLVMLCYCCQRSKR